MVGDVALLGEPALKVADVFHGCQCN
jgi:hypothetical protein